MCLRIGRELRLLYGKMVIRLENENVLVRYKARQVIDSIADAGRIDDIDIDRYCALVAKTIALDRTKIAVRMLYGTDVECEREYGSRAGHGLSDPDRPFL